MLSIAPMPEPWNPAISVSSWPCSMLSIAQMSSFVETIPSRPKHLRYLAVHHQMASFVEAIPSSPERPRCRPLRRHKSRRHEHGIDHKNVAILRSANSRVMSMNTHCKSIFLPFSQCKPFPNIFVAAAPSQCFKVSRKKHYLLAVRCSPNCRVSITVFLG